MAAVLAGTAVAESRELSVSRVRCTAAPAGFDQPEVETGDVLVIVSSGVSIRRTAGREVLVDSTTAYLSTPGTVEEFAHPVPGGDVCTAIHLRPGLIAALAGGDPDLRLPALPTDPASMFALHRITATARAGDRDGTPLTAPPEPGFAEITGSTVSQHRNRLRVGLALDRRAASRIWPASHTTSASPTTPT